MKFPVQSEVATSPDKVFDLMADAANEPQWNSRVARSERVGDGPIGQGAMFLTVNRGKEYDSVISTYDRPTLLVYDVTGSQMDITTRSASRRTAPGPR